MRPSGAMKVRVRASDMSDSVYASINVMAIDDDSLARTVLTEILTTIGMENIMLAENGVDALAQLEQHASAIDLIFCDIEMPEMGGYEFARRLRYGVVPAFRDVPIVMLTGKDTGKNYRSGKIHKINGYLVKPAEVDTVKQMINIVLELD